MSLEDKLKYVRFQIKWYSTEIEKNQLAVDANRKLEDDLVKTIEAMRNASTTIEGEYKNHARLPIDRPCSACGDGDTEMKYHLHSPPFRTS